MKKPNILDNHLDQAPKTHKAGYKEVLNSMEEQIAEIFDEFVMFDGDPSVIKRFADHQDDLPLAELKKLAPGEAITIEIKREMSPKESGWHRAIGPAIATEDAMPTGTWLSRNSQPVQAGEISTYLVVEREYPKQGMEKNIDVKFSARQVQVPGENVLLPKWIVLYNKDLKGEQFEKVMQAVNLDRKTLPYKSMEEASESVEFPESSKPVEKKSFFKRIFGR